MRLSLALLAVACAAPAVAAPIAVESPRWEFEGAEKEIVDYQGKRALHLVGANARLPDAKFDTGVIEFDMAMPGKQSFPGVIFRGQDDGNYEHFYLRPHQ